MKNVHYFPNATLPKEELLDKLQEIITQFRSNDTPIEKVVLSFVNPEGNDFLYAWNCSRSDVISIAEHTKFAIIFGASR